MKSTMIDPIIDFRRTQFSGAIVDPCKILRRELQLAIPQNTTPAQWMQINRGIDYAQLNGIRVEITFLSFGPDKIAKMELLIKHSEGTSC